LHAYVVKEEVGALLALLGTHPERSVLRHVLDRVLRQCRHGPRTRNPPSRHH